MDKARQNLVRKLITNLENPDQKLQSQFGCITYEEWCEKEAARVRSMGRKASVVRFWGQVAIARF